MRAESTATQRRRSAVNRRGEDSPRCARRASRNGSMRRETWRGTAWLSSAKALGRWWRRGPRLGFVELSLGDADAGRWTPETLRTSSSTASSSSRRCASSSETCSKRWSPSGSSTRPRRVLTAWDERACALDRRLGARGARTESRRWYSPRAATSRRRLNGSSGRSLSTRAHTTRSSTPARCSRSAAPQRRAKTARDRSDDLDRRARALRPARRAALGRADAKRARAHRWPRPARGEA